MKNRVYLADDGIIRIIVNGDQTVASVQEMGVAAAKLGAEMRKAGKPALVLDDLLRMGDVPTSARHMVVELVRSSDFDKLAMLGDNPVLKIGANLMLRASGRGKQVRYFDNRDAAIAWLKS